MSGITLTLNGPATALYTGSSANVTTPRPYPLAINGHGYMPDFSFAPYRREAYRHRSIVMLRSQSDTSNTPGQQSLNPAGLWRRTQETWHGGAGQSHFDRQSDTDASSDTRFRSSKGLDVWTKWQLTLLSDTISCRSTGQTLLFLQTVGSRIYLSEHQSLYYATSAAGLSAPTTVSGVPNADITSMCSDGFNVYVASSASGLYTTNRGSSAATQLVTTALTANSICRYVKGRLLVSKDNSIYNVVSTTPAALPTALLTHPNTDWVWVDAAPGPGFIYMAGYSGDKTIIYRTLVKADGTGLDTPVVAGELPDGEIVSSLDGYLGFLEIGTNKGVRIAQFDSSGNVVLGDLGDIIPTASPVRCFEPQDRFIWFGMTNYDSVSTGLGRIDLRTRNGNAPAYASDLMATGQGDVTSVVTFAGVRVFAVAGVGVFRESGIKVASGTMDSGLISFGIADPKVGVFMHYDTAALVGSVSSSVSRDEGAFVSIGSITVAGSVGGDLPILQSLTDHFEARTVLTRRDSSDAVGPTVTRTTMRANPAAATGYDLIIPIRLHEELLVGGTEVPLVPSAELAFLDELRINRRVVIFQEGGQSYTVTVEEIDWLPDSLGRENAELNGVAVISMKTLV